jgi:hypothetical protein
VRGGEEGVYPGEVRGGLQGFDVLGRNHDEPDPQEPTPANQRDGWPGQEPNPVLVCVFDILKDLDVRSVRKSGAASGRKRF